MQVEDTFCVFITSGHHPEWVQEFQFQVVKGKCANFSLMFKFQFCSLLKQNVENLDVY